MAAYGTVQPPAETPKVDNTELLAEARKAYDDDYTLMERDRTLAREDIEFADGDQWLADGQKRRAQLLPTLQINQFDQFLNRVVNEFKKQPFGIKVRPLDNFATVEVANKLQGYCRHVENNSDGKTVYAHALEQATKSGMGWFRVNYDYLNEESFEMDIKLERIVNRFSVVPGIAEKKDYSDMTRCFVVEELAKDVAIKLYGEDVISDFPVTDNTYRHWFGVDTVTIGEYWKCNKIADELLQLHNGWKIYRSVVTDAQLRAKGLRIIKTRETNRRQIEWYKLSGTKVLKKKIWPGYWIPIIPMLGNEAVFPDGEVIYSGLIRNAKDPQRMYNFWASIETQLLSAHSKRRIIAAEGQLEGHEERWKNPEEDILLYKPKSLTGQMVPPPAFEQFDGVPSGVVNAKIACRDDMKSAMGLYNDSIGQVSNARSGVAIARRQQEGETNIFHFLDNASISIKHGGRVIIDLARKVIDGPTWRRVLNERGEQEQVLFNSATVDANGKPVMYDLSVGEFEVYIDTGPSFASKRQETLDLIVELAKYVPEVLKFAADVVFENADGIGMDRLANRARKFIDPKFLEGEEALGNPNEVVSILQTKNQQAQQQIQMLTEGIKLVTAELSKATAKNESNAAELNVKLQVAAMQNKTQLELEKMKQQGGADMQTLKELQEFDSSLEELMGQLVKSEEGSGSALDPNAGKKPPVQNELGAIPPQAGPSPEENASVEEGVLQ